MALAELVSPERYLHSSFEHDAEFVEGRLVQRPIPTWERGSRTTRTNQPGPFSRPRCLRPERQAGGRARPPHRYPSRIPVHCCSYDGQGREYLHFGVAWVWVIDPVSLTGQVHSRNSVINVEDSIFSTDRFSGDISQTEF
jgi:hypothetical protein